MFKLARWINGAAGAAAVVLAGMLALGAPASSQTTTDFKQMKISEQQIQGFIASQKDLAAIADKLQAAGDKPDPKIQAELEAIAKKNGFASFADLDDIAANISMVMAGIDPQSGQYTDPVDAIKKEMEEVKADKSIPDKDKKTMLEEMEQALKTTPPLQFKENIEVVRKFQKEIEKALQ